MTHPDRRICDTKTRGGKVEEDALSHNKDADTVRQKEIFLLNVLVSFPRSAPHARTHGFLRPYTEMLIVVRNATLSYLCFGFGRELARWLSLLLEVLFRHFGSLLALTDSLLSDIILPLRCEGAKVAMPLEV